MFFEKKVDLEKAKNNIFKEGYLWECYDKKCMAKKSCYDQKKSIRANPAVLEHVFFCSI